MKRKRKKRQDDGEMTARACVCWGAEGNEGSKAGAQYHKHRCVCLLESEAEVVGVGVAHEDWQRSRALGLGTQLGL